MSFKILLLLIFICIGVAAGAFIAIIANVPSVEEIKKYKHLQGTRIYADDNTVIAELKIKKGIYQPFKNFPANLKNAVISVEDSRFYSHKGIDYIAILRAILKDIMDIRFREGASTITQQVIKTLFLTSEKTLSRKIKEAYLAIKIEKELTKDEILELYLNNVYFGHGAYGAEMASKLYFGKSVTQITLPESAFLVGLIKAPSIFSPYNDLVKAKEQQEITLMRMEEEGYIKPVERQLAKTRTLNILPLKSNIETYNYFTEYVRLYLEHKYGVDMVYKTGLRVYTTINKIAQSQAQRSLQSGLREIDKRRGWRGIIRHMDKIEKNKIEEKKFFIAPVGDISKGLVLSINNKEAIIRTRGIIGKLVLNDATWAATLLEPSGIKKVLKDFKLTDILKQGDIIWVKVKSVSNKQLFLSLEQMPEVEGALVSIESQTGYIKALIGGFDFSKSDYNRAVYAKRQAGSSFKPVIYAAALEQAFTPATIIIDEPISFNEWEPKNYDNKFHGKTTLRDALAYSRNVVTIKLLQKVGIDNVISFAKNIGITATIQRDLTIALGSISITPLELTSAYTTFANNGKRIKPIFIKTIVDLKHNILENNEVETTDAISPQTAYLITSMMQDVIRYGTGGRANIDVPAAGKTGTSDDYKDAWFVGYTPNLVTSVWIGFDDMRRSLGQDEVGGKIAAPIWANFMKTQSVDGEDFKQPEGIIKLFIDPLIGTLTNNVEIGIWEYFKIGTEPKSFTINEEIPFNKEQYIKQQINPLYD